MVSGERGVEELEGPCLVVWDVRDEFVLSTVWDVEGEGKGILADGWIGGLR